MAANRSPLSSDLDSSTIVDEDAFVAPETNKEAENAQSDRKVLWSSSNSQSKTPHRSILAREIVPPRLSPEPVSVLWSSDGKPVITSASRSKQQTILPETFYPFDMLFEKQEDEEDRQTNKPSFDDDDKGVQNEQLFEENAPTSSKKKKKKTNVATPTGLMSPISPIIADKEGASTRKAMNSFMNEEKNEIETKLQKLKEEALRINNNADDIHIVAASSGRFVAVPSMNASSIMATPQSSVSSLGKTTTISNQTPSPIPGLLFGLQKSPEGANNGQYMTMRTPASTKSVAKRAASSSSSKVPGAGSVQLTSWWLSGGPPDFSPPSVSSWLDSTSGKKSGKSQTPSDVLLDHLKRESASVKAFEDKLKHLVEEDQKELDNNIQPNNKKGRFTVL